MRKNLYLGLIACAALTMTGCSNDEISYDSSKQEAQAIQFDTYLGKNVQGRASELSTDNLKNFGVFASYTQSAVWSDANKMNFMFDQKVEKVSSDWKYTPLKYWPEKDGEKISFFAYAPYYDFTSESSNTKAITPKSSKSAAGAPQLTFTITNNASQMVDFTSCVIMNKETQDDEAAVTLNFKHELARVNFAAKLDRDAFGDNDANKTKVNIKSIKLIAGGAFIETADYTFATTTGKLGDWDYDNLTSTSEDLNVTLIMNTATPAAGDLGGYVIPGVLVPTTEPVSLFSSGQYLFLIPNSSSTTENVTVEIAYDIVTVDSALENGHVYSAATKRVDIDGKLFEQGKAKNYTFTIGLHEIKVTPTIETWSETESTANPSINGSNTEPTA